VGRGPGVVHVLHVLDGRDGQALLGSAALDDDVERRAGRRFDDLDELVACDRLLVIFKGRLVNEFGANWRDQEVVANHKLVIEIISAFIVLIIEQQGPK